MVKKQQQFENLVHIIFQRTLITLHNVCAVHGGGGGGGANTPCVLNDIPECAEHPLT